MAEIVIGVFPAPPHDAALALHDPAVALLVKQIESELSDYELAFDTPSARELRQPQMAGLRAGSYEELVVEFILPAATAATVRAVVDLAVSWLRGLGKADRAREKAVDICGPDGALLATVKGSEYGTRRRVRFPKDARRRWRRWFPWRA
jgi:hypothetical protein